MNWALTIVVGLLTAVAGCFGTGYLGSLCVSWHRVSSREGGSGYFVIFMGLLGLIAGLIVGVVCARVVAGWRDGNFLQAQGLALGVAAALLVVSGGLAYLTAEFPPKHHGQELMVEAELRYPAGVSVPPSQGDEWKWRATLRADSGKRRPVTARLDLPNRRKEDGRWIVPVQLDLETVVAGKTIEASDGTGSEQYVPVSIPGRPKSVTEDWSQWSVATFRGNLKPFAPGEAIEARWRVRYRKS